jgi:hypothetical protein
VDDSALHWRQEKVSFNAAYGGERVIAYLFLPRNAEPPYQTIVYFASGIARQSRSSDEMESELRFVDFLPRIGRAVLFLIYKGTYERHLDHPITGAFFTRDLVIAWSRDFSDPSIIWKPVPTSITGIWAISVSATRSLLSLAPSAAASKQAPISERA